MKLPRCWRIQKHVLLVNSIFLSTTSETETFSHKIKLISIPVPSPWHTFLAWGNKYSFVITLKPNFFFQYSSFTLLVWLWISQLNYWNPLISSMISVHVSVCLSTQLTYAEHCWACWDGLRRRGYALCMMFTWGINQRCWLLLLASIYFL